MEPGTYAVIQSSRYRSIDKDEERESKPGENVVRESPRALDIQSPAAQRALQEELLHSRQTGYTPDYNALIRKYFEELEKK